ncbi:MAG TPA: YqaA family protein [Rubrobacteraceae bacterium]|nr:YqaA family protein [Rubrobacteraceae bacterium]
MSHGRSFAADSTVALVTFVFLISGDGGTFGVVSLVYSYGALFFWSFLAATVIPLSSEPALIFLVLSEGAVALPVMAGTVGNVLGACTTYWISRRATHVLAGPRKASKGQKRASRMFKRYGQPVLLLSWVPILGDGLVALAGATRMSFARFCLWVTLGKGLRYLAIALAALNFF